MGREYGPKVGWVPQTRVWLDYMSCRCEWPEVSVPGRVGVLDVCGAPDVVELTQHDFNCAQTGVSLRRGFAGRCVECACHEGVANLQCEKPCMPGRMP